MSQQSSHVYQVALDCGCVPPSTDEDLAEIVLEDQILKKSSTDLIHNVNSSLSDSSQLDIDRINAWTESISSFTTEEDSVWVSASPSNYSEEQAEESDPLQEDDHFVGTNEDQNENIDSLYLTSELSEEAQKALMSHSAFMQKHNLKDKATFDSFLAHCSVETLEELFVTAADAKNAALLRRAAIVLDLDYWMRKIAPLARMYQDDGLALNAIEARIASMKAECNKDDEHRIDFFGLDCRLPGTTRFHPSFSYTHRDLQSKVEVEASFRPWANSDIRFVLEKANTGTANQTKAVFPLV